MSNPKFRLGAVSYWNAKPLYHTLLNRDDIEIVQRLPAQLAAGLDAGEFDAALMPVVDHLRGHGDGILGDGIVGATGKVRSVLLFSNVPIEEIKSVALDTSSHSSVALITVILRDFYKLSPTFIDHGPQLAQMLQKADAALLIGDPALEANRPDCPFLIYDLPEQWQKFTGLSFVFAAWIARKNLENREELAAILNEARDEGEKNVAEIVAGVEDLKWRETVSDYLTNTIEYHLDDKHQDGLNSFARHARALGLTETLFVLPWDETVKKYGPANRSIEFTESTGNSAEEHNYWGKGLQDDFENAQHFYIQYYANAGKFEVLKSPPPFSQALTSRQINNLNLHECPGGFPTEIKSVERAWRIYRDWNDWEILFQTEKHFYLWNWLTSA